MRSSVEVQRGSDECAGQEDVRDVLLGDESEGGRDGSMNVLKGMRTVSVILTWPPATDS